MPTCACCCVEQSLETHGRCGPASWEFRNLTQTSHGLIKIKGQNNQVLEWIFALKKQLYRLLKGNGGYLIMN